MANEILPSADLAKYRELFGGGEASDSAKDEKILIIASIMQAFIDASYGISATQLSVKSKRFESSHFSEVDDTMSAIAIIQTPAVGNAHGSADLGT